MMAWHGVAEGGLVYSKVNVAFVDCIFEDFPLYTAAVAAATVHKLRFLL